MIADVPYVNTEMLMWSMCVLWTNTLRLKRKDVTPFACYNFNIHQLALLAHITSASALPAKTGNREIASVHLRAVCCFATKHKTFKLLLGHGRPCSKRRVWFSCLHQIAPKDSIACYLLLIHYHLPGLSWLISSFSNTVHWHMVHATQFNWNCNQLITVQDLEVLWQFKWELQVNRVEEIKQWPLAKH